MTDNLPSHTIFYPENLEVDLFDFEKILERETEKHGLRLKVCRSKDVETSSGQKVHRRRYELFASRRKKLIESSAFAHDKNDPLSKFNMALVSDKVPDARAIYKEIQERVNNEIGRIEHNRYAIHRHLDSYVYDY